MSIARDDRDVTDGLGRALSGALIWWCTQPATTDPLPPVPLADIFTSLSAGTPLTQPVITDGFGHAFAYMDDSIFYTVVIQHPLFGENPIVLIDQSLGGGGSGGATVTPFAGVPSGTIDGTNTVFTFSVPVSPSQSTVWNNIALIPGLGYTVAWASGTLTVTYAVAPQPPSGGVAGDSLYVEGFYVA